MIDKSRCKALAGKLRCASSVGVYPSPEQCFHCAFCEKDDITAIGIPVRPDIVYDGKKYAISCNSDALMQDAAEYLDELLAGYDDDAPIQKEKKERLG